VTEDPRLVVRDQAAWRTWLDANEASCDGIWLILAKKGTSEPTSLTYPQALDEALCSGWIDGQKKGVDEQVTSQRFTPRRKASLWSQRNIGLVAALTAEGRMRPRGQAEIDRAQADGRWDRAYAGQATAEVPDDLVAALASATPAAAVLFAGASSTNRYAFIHRLVTAPNATTRTNRLAKLIAMLERGELPF
jgi:uncharacterized protein YdeI (YjbR/CyaY-like superfamily)